MLSFVVRHVFPKIQFEAKQKPIFGAKRKGVPLFPNVLKLVWIELLMYRPYTHVGFTWLTAQIMPFKSICLLKNIGIFNRFIRFIGLCDIMPDLYVTWTDRNCNFFFSFNHFGTYKGFLLLIVKKKTAGKHILCPYHLP